MQCLLPQRSLTGKLSISFSRIVRYFSRAYDGHTGWANSKALSLAGISKDTADPPNGAIVRDPQTGDPTGALKESAQRLVSKIIPEAFSRRQTHGLPRRHQMG